MIGRDLIARTNSERLVQIGSALPLRLSSFLRSSSAVAEVKLGDEPSPIGDGTASSRLILSNAVGERLGIRLRSCAEPERFRVLGFWTVTEPSGASKSNAASASAARREIHVDGQSKQIPAP
jgi:hypothetical protein